MNRYQNRDFLLAFLKAVPGNPPLTAAADRIETLEDKARRLLGELSVCPCACTLKERASGHRVGCNWPDIQAAADELREAMR